MFFPHNSIIFLLVSYTCTQWVLIHDYTHIPLLFNSAIIGSFYTLLFLCTLYPSSIWYANFLCFWCPCLCLLCVGFPLHQETEGSFGSFSQLFPRLYSIGSDYCPTSWYTIIWLYVEHTLGQISQSNFLFIYGTDKGNSEYQPPWVPDVTVWDENLSSLLMKKVLQVFLLNPMQQLSEKVWLASILSFQIIFFALNDSVVFFFPFQFSCFDWIFFLLYVSLR